MTSEKNGLRITALLTLCATLVIVMLLTGSKDTEARTITVDENGGADYEKIQDAMDVAEDGDTVRVYEGLYEENVVVDKSVSLEGNGTDFTTIDGGGSGDVVVISADWVNLSGFTVTGSGDHPDAGIKVESNNIAISNCVCSRNHYGMHLEGDHNTITSTTCDSNNYISISIKGDYNTLANNICSNHNLTGIELLHYSDHNTLENNTFLNNNRGISLVKSSHDSITNNYFSSNDMADISLIDSSYSFLSGNVMDMGIHIAQPGPSSLENWNTHNIDITNTVNGKPVYYYKNSAGITVPSDAAQAILANCTRMVVKNLDCSNVTKGISVAFSSNITVSNSICSNNRESGGIDFYYSNNNILENNVCNSNNGIGILLMGDGNNCNTISNNTCISNNRDGIRLYKGSNNYFLNNTCQGNSGYSTRATIRRSGICIQGGSYNIISYSICSDNDYGIFLTGADYNTISNCTITGNNVGFYVSDYSEEDIALHNDVYDNRDFGIDTDWNHGHGIDSRYNFWGDISGPYHPTANPDGKGDNITDHVEFDPWFEEEVSWPPAAHIESISPDPAFEGDSIRFEGSGKDDDTITTYAWRSSLDSEFYNGTESTFDYSDLSIGEHSIYFKVLDNHGAWSDEVNSTLTINEYIPLNQKPTISITSPTNNSENSGHVTISGSASDADGTVTTVEISINSGEWENVTGIDPTGIDPWSYEWDTSVVTNGDYEMKIRAYDGEEYSEVIVWNLKVKNDGGGDDDDDDSPGFGAGAALLAAIVVVEVLVVSGKRKKMMVADQGRGD